jgi:transposase InsO family protein
VHRVYRDLRLNLPRRTRRRIPRRPKQPFFAPSALNETWAMDFMQHRWAEEKNVEILYIQPGKPVQNAFMERFNRSYQDGSPGCLSAGVSR